MSLSQHILQTLATLFGLIAFIVGVVRKEPFLWLPLWFYNRVVGSQAKKFEAKGGFVPLGGKKQIRIIARLINKLPRLYYIRKRTHGDDLEQLQARRQQNVAGFCVLVATGCALASIWTA